MRRVRWTRALGAVFVLLATALSSGCVVIAPGQFLSEQRQTIGDFHQIANLCASNSAAGGCSALGASGMPALSSTSQVLIGLQLPSAVTPPASFTSTGLEALPFAQSPTYAAELQRLAPAPAGARWVGYISAVIDYADNGGPQTLPVAITDTLGQGDDGSPFRGPLAFDVTHRRPDGHRRLPGHQARGLWSLAHDGLRRGSGSLDERRRVGRLRRRPGHEHLPDA